MKKILIMLVFMCSSTLFFTSSYARPIQNNLQNCDGIAGEYKGRVVVQVSGTKCEAVINNSAIEQSGHMIRVIVAPSQGRCSNGNRFNFRQDSLIGTCVNNAITFPNEGWSGARFGDHVNIVMSGNFSGNIYLDKVSQADNLDQNNSSADKENSISIINNTINPGN